jgi:NAD+ synthase (glutamine-hydrolysing)
MKTALAQMRVEPGRPDLNLKRMKEFIARAKDEGADLVAFPELCVSGYLLGDLWTSESFCRDLAAINAELGALSDGIVLAYGNLHLDETRRNKDGRARKYNAAFAWQDGKPLPRTASANAAFLPEGVSVKTLLPNYRIFDDERYFFSLWDLSLELGVEVESLLAPFEARMGGCALRLGIEICEDLWFTDYRLKGRPFNVSGILVENGAQAILNLSASPWTLGKGEARDRRVRDSCADLRERSGRDAVPFYYVNCVGVQNNGKNFVTFDGDSTVYGADAEIAAHSGAPWEEELLVFDGAAFLKGATTKAEKPSASGIALKCRAAIEAIKAVDLIMGGSAFPWIIGLSGGVDSAVVACLLERAVGKERVQAFNLPSRYNSAATKGAAAHVASELGIPLHVVPIEELTEANAKALSEFPMSGLNLENLQAKVRGTSILSNAAAALGGLMTNNGNKLEIAIGYATLYGDVDGAIAPLGDLLKTEVFEMARYLNDEVYGREVVPAVLLPDSGFNFELPPTAELKHDQIDPMKWGYHDALLAAFTDYRKWTALDALGAYVDGGLAARLGIPASLLARWGVESGEEFVKDLEWFAGGVRRAVFKRVQAPPIVIMSKGSYGYDIRESQLSDYRSPEYLRLREIARAMKAPGRKA